MKEYVNINKKARAFTLAEVLVTLAVLGIVAAMIIPTLIVQNQRSALKTQLKRAYSDLEQISRMYYAENNISLNDAAIAANLPSSRVCCYIQFSEIIDGEYLSIKKSIAGNNAKSETVKNFIKNFDYKTLTNEPVEYSALDDGYMKDKINRDYYGEKGKNNDQNFVKGGPCVTIDVNGHEKGPNRWGVDLFSFAFENNGDVSPCEDVCSKNDHEYQANGRGCTKYALMDVNPDDNSKNYWRDFLNSIN